MPSAPSPDPEQVLDYVGRYTHRVAISNNRLLDIDDGQVRFRWKDYRDDSQQKTMTLAADEFIRRFLLHVLPEGFQRIRYYGFLGNRYRHEKLARCRQLLGMAPPASSRPNRRPRRIIATATKSSPGFLAGHVPVCHHGRMRVDRAAGARPAAAIIDSS